MLLGVCQGQRTTREEMGRKMKCGKKRDAVDMVCGNSGPGLKKKKK